MPTYQVALNEMTKEVLIQNEGAALPSGCINAGTFIDENGPFEPNVADVLYHSVRDVLFKRRWLSMQGIKILSVIPTPITLAIQGVTTSSGVLGSPVSIQLTRVGGTGPFTWALDTKPHSSMVISASGLITWAAPSAGANQSIVARITDGLGATDTHAIALTITSNAVAPGAVQGLTASTATETTQPLSWTAPATGTGPFTYRVGYRLGSSTGAYTSVGGTITGTSYTVTGLTANTQYDYQVYAVNSEGNGAFATLDNRATAAAQGAEYRPIFFVAPAMIQNGNFDAAMAAGTRVGTSGSKAVASFAVQTTANNYGWMALPAAASSAGATFTDLVAGFPGDWIAASEAGDMEEGGAVPATSTVVVTYLGQQYRLFRMQWLNSSPTAKNWSIA